MKSSTITVCNWNMQHNPAAWNRLDELGRTHGVQVALLQEAVPPSGGDWRTFPSVGDSDKWVISAPAGRRRNFASAVVVLDRALAARPVLPTALGAAEYGKFAVSHPGQFSVAEVDTHSGQTITVISLYGIWDRDDRYLFSEATLHRAISDLTLLLQEKKRSHVVLAGDLNVFYQWDRATYDSYWAPRYDTVFTRLAAYGLNLVGPFGDQPLDGCECGRDLECRHVRTFAFQRKPENRLNQLDYAFATPSLRLAECRVLDDAAAWHYSDHLPVITTFSLDD